MKQSKFFLWRESVLPFESDAQIGRYNLSVLAVTLLKTINISQQFHSGIHRRMIKIKTFPCKNISKDVISTSWKLCRIFFLKKREHYSVWIRGFCRKSLLNLRCEKAAKFVPELFIRMMERWITRMVEYLKTRNDGISYIAKCLLVWNKSLKKWNCNKIRKCVKTCAIPVATCGPSLFIF